MVKHALASLCALLALALNAEAADGYRQIKQGEQFTLSLPANPTTGYRWMLRTLPAPLLLISTDYQPDTSCKAEITGCGGKQIFTFQGVEEGEGKLMLINARAWEMRAAREHSEVIKVN